MASNDYRFVTRWTVQGTADEVFAILSDPTELPRWWPSVYLTVDEVERGDADGKGRVASLHTKGWLPYTLRWTLRTTGVRSPNEIEFEAFGDFEGKGKWTLTERGSETEVEFTWEIAARKPLLQNLSFALKPAFEANHQWAMARGRESLELELRRRREADPEARARIPAPPGATSSAPLPWMLAGVGTLGAVAAGALLLRRGRR